MIGVATWCATAVSAAALLTLRVIRHGLVRAVLIVSVSVTCALWHVQLRPVVRSPVEHVAWCCALLSMVWALAVVMVGSPRRRSAYQSIDPPPMLALASSASILFGVVAGVILAVLLAMRCAVVVAESMNGGPGPQGFDLLFTADGLWSLVCLWIGCAVSLIATRDGRLATCTFLVGFMGLTWACLLHPVFVTAETRGYAPGSALLALMVLQAVWLFATAYLAEWYDRRPCLPCGETGPDLDSPSLQNVFSDSVQPRHRVWQSPIVRSGETSAGEPSVPSVSDPHYQSNRTTSTGFHESRYGDQTVGPDESQRIEGSRGLKPEAPNVEEPTKRSDSPRPPRAGLRICCDTAAVVMALLICYHIAVPRRVPLGGFEVSGVACLLSAVLAVSACCRWLRRSWSPFTAEVGLGHMSLAACSGATIAATSCGLPLQEQYPATFAAVMIGLCLAAVVCGWLALRGYRLRAHEQGKTTGVARLAPYARRFAFVDAALAFLVGVVMMVWPRLPTVATMDDSLGRITSGLSANLLLLFVALWCGRRLRQPAFHVLTVLAMLLVGGFLLVRILPFSSHVG